LAGSQAPDACAAALELLARRELSQAQLRARLARRGCDDAGIDRAVARLTADGTLDDRRTARAAARLEATVRKRGPARVRQRLLALGIDPDTTEEAVSELFEEVDREALLDQALARRLRGQAVGDLDEKARARIIRGLAAQGFALEDVLRRLSRRTSG
jgi:regulatory protein